MFPIAHDYIQRFEKALSIIKIVKWTFFLKLIGNSSRENKEYIKLKLKPFLLCLVLQCTYSLLAFSSACVANRREWDFS